MFLQGRHQWGVAWQRRHAVGEQKTLDIHRDAFIAAPGIEGIHCFSDDLPNARFHFGWVFLGDHPPIELEADFARYDVGVGAAFYVADVQIGVRDARHGRSDLLVAKVFGIEGVHDGDGALQGIDPGGRNAASAGCRCRGASRVAGSLAVSNPGSSNLVSLQA